MWLYRVVVKMLYDFIETPAECITYAGWIIIWNERIWYFASEFRIVHVVSVAGREQIEVIVNLCVRWERDFWFVCDSMNTDIESSLMVNKQENKKNIFNKEKWRQIVIKCSYQLPRAQ